MENLYQDRCLRGIEIIRLAQFRRRFHWSLRRPSLFKYDSSYMWQRLRKSLLDHTRAIASSGQFSFAPTADQFPTRLTRYPTTNTCRQIYHTRYRLKIAWLAQIVSSVRFKNYQHNYVIPLRYSAYHQTKPRKIKRHVERSEEKCDNKGRWSVSGTRNLASRQCPPTRVRLLSRYYPGNSVSE